MSTKKEYKKPPGLKTRIVQKVWRFIRIYNFK